MLEYKDSYGYGLAFLLALAGVVIDMTAVRCLLGIAAITLLIWPIFHRRSGMTPAMTLTAVCIIGFVGGIIWQSISYGWPWKALHPADPNNPLDLTIQVECVWSQIPDTIPANGWYEIQIAGPPVIGGVISSSLQPGSPNNAKIMDDPNQWYRCRFTNFGPAAIPSVEAMLRVDLREVVARENGTTSGKVIYSSDIMTPRATLGVGDRGIFDFYMRNNTKYYVQITLPETARVQTVGHEDWQTVRLIVQQFPPVFFQPFVPKEVKPPESH
jgi:hypothetical protein